MSSATATDDFLQALNEVIAEQPNEVAPQIILQKPTNCTGFAPVCKLDDYTKALSMIRAICDRPEESSEDGFRSFDTSTLQLRSTFNTEAREQIRSVGALLLFLSVSLNKDTFSNDTVSPPIHAFLPLSLERYMAIDRVDIPLAIHLGDTSQLRYRQHGQSPFARQGNGSRKAGLHTLQSPRSHSLPTRKTTLETVLLFSFFPYRWMQCPSCDTTEISDRHDVIAFLLQSQLRELGNSLRRELQRVADIAMLIRRILQQTGRDSDWLRLVDSIAAAGECGRVIGVMVK